MWNERTETERGKIRELISCATIEGTKTEDTIQGLNQAIWILMYGDVPSCHECGVPMTRTGSTFKCENCGALSGSS